VKAKSTGEKIETDLRWEAMIPVLERKRQVFIHAQTEKEITAAVSFSLSHNLRMVLVGGAESWRVSKLLADHKVSVVLNETHSLPLRNDDDIDLPFRLPSILQKAGVRFCISKGPFWDSRNLPFQAGTAVAHGLGKEEALRAITLSPAEIGGIADRTGSIETGKDANLIVTKGDVLDMKTAEVELAYIQGRKIDLGNKQKDLYKKFRTGN
jgi:imidazolonepropionase-like amidohydrolase